MKLQIHPTLIFRTPKFSINANLHSSWPELKASIKISSETFYEHIKDVEAEDLDGLPKKVLFTIWKYFNRSKYRSTPYGTFAGFSLLKQSTNQIGNEIVIDDKLKLHEFNDWPIKNEIHFDTQKLLSENVLLFSNSSYYLTINSIRYIACTEGQFELAEIEYNDFALKILNACLQPIRFNELIPQLQLDDVEMESLYGLIEGMLSIQLLFSDHDPNIIGDNYFDRIDYKPQHNVAKYIIAERAIIAGQLNYGLLDALPNLINLLKQAAPINEKKALKEFVNRFVKKFEQREVSLVQALDPEIGVGYDELEQAGQNDDFVSQFKDMQSGKFTINEYDKFKEEIKNKFFTESFEAGKPLFLDKILIPQQSNKLSLPNSISLMMSVVDDLICVEQLGGATANSLSGRFTIASDDVYAYTKEISEIEKKANPNVLFFDVAYMVEANVDNINRRKLIYDYQLSILNFDTSEHPLLLNDIMLSVHKGEVILRSKKYNKRLIPKIPSAYNYARSDLSVFRLFCDLQHQGVQSNLILKLEHLVPGLNHYPRFQYKNFILSLAKWRITHKDFFDFLGEDHNVDLCKEYLLKLGVSQCFKTGNSDQTLSFDMANDFDMSCFLLYMQKQKSCYLEEVLLPTKALVTDEEGRPYNAEFILALTHDDQVYSGIQKLEGIESQPTKWFFPPGSEWVYFEIFCHQQRSDNLLVTSISTYLNEHYKEIKQWFFIRYNENGDHIRLRVLLNDVHEGQNLITSLSNHLQDELTTGLVSDIMIKTYKREIERYGNDLIEDVEAHFYADSAYVLSLIQTEVNVHDKYNLCVHIALKIQQEEDLFEPMVFSQMILNFSNSFNSEHHLDASTFKKLNATYQIYKKEEFLVLTEDQQEYFDAFYRSLKEIILKCKEERRPKLFGDLMHMHVNRLFNKDQRTHEMVMYYYLLKDMQRIKAMSKQSL